MDRRPSITWIAALARVTLAVVVLTSVAALGALAYLRGTGHELIAVRGASMGGSLPLGSLAIAQPVSAASVSVGDIVLVARRPLGRPAPTPFVHRVSTLEREGASVVVTTRGDANERGEREPYVLPAVVLRVRHSVPYAGFSASLAATPWARMGTLALLVVLVAGGLLRRILRDAPEARGATAASR